VPALIAQAIRDNTTVAPLAEVLETSHAA
jgi:hypothetical protein